MDVSSIGSAISGLGSYDIAGAAVAAAAVSEDTAQMQAVLAAESAGQIIDTSA